MKANRKNRNMNFEPMEKRELFAADLGLDVAVSPASAAEPVCYLKYKLERAFIKSWSTSGDADDAQPEQASIFVRIPGVPGDVKADGYDQGTAFTADSFSFGVEREMKESGEKGGTADMNIGVGELQEVSTDAADQVMNGWNTTSDADDRPTEEVAFYYNKIAF